MKNSVTQFVRKVAKFTVLPRKVASLLNLFKNFVSEVLIFVSAFNDDKAFFNFHIKIKRGVRVTVPKTTLR